MMAWEIADEATTAYIHAREDEQVNHKIKRSTVALLFLRLLFCYLPPYFIVWR